MVTRSPIDLHHIMSSTNGAVDDEPVTDTSTYYYYYYYDYYSSLLPCHYENLGARILPILFSLYFVVGFLGNMLVVWVVCMGVKLRSMTEVCLLNLALADLLLVSSFPFMAHYARDQWIFGDVMCTVVLSVHYIGFYSVIFFIVLMSVNQYIAIVHDVFASRIKSRTYGILASVFAWIVAVSASLPELMHIKTNTFSQNIYCHLYYPTIDLNSYHSSTFFGIFKANVICLIIPLIIIGIFYSMILKRLLTAHSSRKQDICHVIVVIVVFFCCYAPYNIATFVKALELEGLITYSCDFSKAISLRLQITVTLAYSHTCIYPILFVFVREKYRGHLVSLLYKTPCGRRFMNNNITQATGSVYSQNTNDERTSSVNGGIENESILN